MTTLRSGPGLYQAGVRFAAAAFLSALLASWLAGPLARASYFRVEPPPGPETAAGLLPADLLAYAEVEGLGDLVRGFPESALWSRIQKLPAFRKYRVSKDYGELLAGLGFVQMVSGRPPHEALGRALGRRMAAGLALPEEGGEPGVLVIVDAESEEIRVEVVDSFTRFVETVAPGKIQRGTHRGVEGVAVDEKVWFAGVGRYLVFASADSLLRKAVDLAHGNGDSFDVSPLHAELRQRTSQTARGAFAVDLARIAQMAGGERLIPERSDDPGASLILGDLLEVAARSPLVVGEIKASAQGFGLEIDLPVAHADLPEQFRAFCHEQALQGGLTLLQPAEGMISISGRRNLADWWQDRGALLQASTEKGFAEFETGLGAFFGGRSVSDELFPAMADELLLVGARQTFAGRAVPPKARFPSGAVVLRLEDAERWAQELAVAFNSLIGIINVERGQKGQTPLLFYTEPFGDVTIYGARFLEGDDRPFDVGRHNFSPAMARIGDRVVLASADELLKAVIQQLREGSAAELPAGTLTQVRIDGQEMARVLEDNHAVLVAQNMLEKGHTEAQARQVIDGLVDLARSFAAVDLVSKLGEGGFEVSLEARLAEPVVPAAPLGTQAPSDGAEPR